MSTTTNDFHGNIRIRILVLQGNLAVRFRFAICNTTSFTSLLIAESKTNDETGDRTSNVLILISIPIPSHTT